MGQTVRSKLLKDADSELKQLMTSHSFVHYNEEQLLAQRERTANDSVKMKTWADSLLLGHRNAKVTLAAMRCSFCIS